MPSDGHAALPEASMAQNAQASASRAAQTAQSALNEGGGASVIVVDCEGRVVFWSPESASLYGYSAKEALSRIVDTLISPEPINIRMRREQVMCAEHRQKTQTRRRRKHGDLFWAESTMSCWTKDNGQLEGLVIVDRELPPSQEPSQDLTPIADPKDKPGAAASRSGLDTEKSHPVPAQTELFFELASDLMGIADLDGRFLRINPPFQRILGYRRNELESFPLPTLVHPQDRSEVLRHLKSLRSRAGTAAFDARLRHHRGGYRRLEWSFRSIPEQKLLFATAKDVTEDRHARAALQDSEQRFRELAENISEVFWLASTNMKRFLYVSPAYEMIWGRTAGPLYDRERQWMEAVHPDDRRRLVHARKRVMQEGGFHLEYRVMRPDGSTRWVLDRAFPVTDHDGQVKRIAGITTDITAQKRTQGALERLAGNASGSGDRAAFVHKLIQDLGYAVQADDVLLIELGRTGTPGLIYRWTPKGFLEPGPFQTQNTPFQQLFHGKELMLSIGAHHQFPEHHPCKVHEMLMGLPIFRGADEQAGILICARHRPLDDFPVTASIMRIFADRLSAEEARRHSEAIAWKHEAELAHIARLHTVGEMGSGIAHEVNQPLYAIMNHADAALFSIQDREGLDALKQDIEDIATQAERAAAIIGRLRRFLRKAAPERKRMDLNETVADVTRFISFQIRMNEVQVVQSLHDGPLLVSADATQIEQVLVNLSQNAIEAMSEQDPSLPRVLSLSTRQTDRHAEVIVKDSGPGPSIGPEEVFSAFVSSKPNGLGIGLSISRSIIESHEGLLECRLNTEERGASFYFRLPLAEADPDDDAEAS